MSIATATCSAFSPSQAPLAWPVVGGRDIAFGNSLGADEDMRALQKIGAKLRIARNQTIFSQGDAADYGYKVVSGVVRMCYGRDEGFPEEARFLGVGDSWVEVQLVGEDAFNVGEFPPRKGDFAVIDRRARGSFF